MDERREKKMKKFISVILSVFILTGCQRKIAPNHNETQTKQPEETQTSTATPIATETVTNTPIPAETTPSASLPTKTLKISNGNLLSGGKVVEYDGWLYYSDGDAEQEEWQFKRQTLDGKKVEMLHDAMAFDIHIYDGWLIYDDIWYEGGGNLIKSRLDGTEKIVISPDKYGVVGVRMHGSDIYYMSDYDECLYKTSIDGDERELICDGWVQDYYIINNKLLVRASWDGKEKYLVEYDLTNNERKIIGEGSLQPVWEYENRYYCYRDTDSYLYSMNLDGTDVRKVPNIKGGYFNYSDGWVYYRNTDDGYALYKARIDGSELTKLSSARPSRIYIYGDTIYYEAYSEEKAMSLLYRMSTDGGESELVN